MDLSDSWRLQSSCKVSASGAQISSSGFDLSGWHKATVPSTVLAALVADGTYPDPYFGMNLRSIPGTTYPIAENFAHLAMPDDSPFKCSWWYRTEFVLPRKFRNQKLRLHFQGINYRANVWLNQRQIAESSETAGAYREFAVDISSARELNGTNILAVETFAPEPKDLAINWVDWNPMPPDKDMGLWKRVYISASGPVSLRSPLLKSKVDPNQMKAAVNIAVVAENNTAQPVNGVLKATVGGVRVQQEVELAALETREVIFAPETFRQLNIPHPKLWWPYQLGEPNLYNLQLEFEVGAAVSDTLSARVGIREITSELDERNNRVFKINGKRLLIRGGGWAPDMLLRQSSQRLRQEFSYVKQLHLNTLRLEGKMETDDFFNLADEQGILVMAGWCCCDIWEEWDKWQPEHHRVATESLRSQALRLRSHPSVLVWLYGSDNPPPPDVEREYLKILDETNWPNPAISSASHTPTQVTGVSGVKMTGPYQYVPPSYWLNPTSNILKRGGAFGFNTETSPGPAIPALDSLKKMLPKDHLWPIDEVWNYHAGGGEFKDLSVFNKAMDATYGPPKDLTDYLKKSQAMAYDGERAMFEAYRRNKYTSTGLIQWMLNNAWPSTIWHLYDYFLQPAGGFFGTRKANEPVHIQFSYDDRSVVAVNALPHPVSGLKATAELYDFALQKKFEKTVELSPSEDSSQRLFNIPDLGEEAGLTFVRLVLQDKTAKVVSSNFYWLPPHYSSFDWAATTFVNTPSPTYEDLSRLNELQPVRLQISAKRVSKGGKDSVVVRVANPSQGLAFQICLRTVRQQDGREILPVLWDDNYFELMPGESRIVSAAYEDGQLQHIQGAIQVSGWNVTEQSIPLSRPPASR